MTSENNARVQVGSGGWESCQGGGGEKGEVVRKLRKEEDGEGEGLFEKKRENKMIK